MSVFQNARGHRPTAGDQTEGRPTYEFVVHSVRQPEDDADTPDLVLRRSPIDAPVHPAREEITVIRRDVGGRRLLNKEISLAAPEKQAEIPVETPVPAPVEAVYDHDHEAASVAAPLSDDIARVVDCILAEEEAQGLAPASSDGSPFDEPPALPRPSADPREAAAGVRAPAHSRYTKRVEYDRS